MSKQKYNRELLKIEFFNSEFQEVKSFFEYKYNTYTSQMKTKSKGWTKEKKGWLLAIEQKSLEISTKKTANRLSIPKEALIAHKVYVLSLMGKKLKEDSISVGDLSTIYKTIKIELGEPINIKGGQYNRNIDDSLSPEDEALLLDIFGDK